jgi:hypothetical protein
VIVASIPLFSAQNHISVPLDHRVYPILKSAEIRGIIDTGMQVRPYTTNTVLEYLKIIETDSSVSKSEKALAQELIDELNQETQPDNSFNSMLNSGSYTTYSEKLDTSAAFGARLNFQYAHSLTDVSVFDSRNGGDFYLRGDIADVASFHMNIGLRFDHLDPRIYLKNDFTIPSEGKYDTFWDHQGEHLLYYGIYTEPELSLSLLQGNLRLRWASIQRDWGVGTNNFMISASARSFNGIEVSYDIASWLRYAFITGNLGKFSLTDVFDSQAEFFKEYHFSDALHHTQYDNNFTAHRVEVDLPFNTTFGIYESVIYRKRFEFGYLNPLSVIMFEQNIMGDFDNMLAGFDLEWKLPGILRLYGSAATTEMNEINPSRFLIAPRNVLGLQAGVDVNIPLLSFSTATLQYTYLAPFFYTHYPHTEKRITHYEYDSDSDTYIPVYETVITQQLNYVNKGENLGYPLRPNSDEILLAIHMQAPDGWDGSVTMKYQRRSGQYGFNMDKYMRYAAAKINAYDDKDFAGNLFEKTLGIKTTVNKTLKKFPIRISASYLFSMTTERTTPPTPAEVWDEENDQVITDSDPSFPNPVDYDETPVITYEVSGPWDPWVFSHALQIGVDIWY